MFGKNVMKNIFMIIVVVYVVFLFCNILVVLVGFK